MSLCCIEQPFEAVAPTSASSASPANTQIAKLFIRFTAYLGGGC